MPTVTISYDDLCGLVGKALPKDKIELQEAFLSVKSELESFDGDKIRLEVKDSNRIDLLSVEGIAHTLKGFYSIEKGLRKIETRESGLKIMIDPSITDIRPYIAVGIVKNLHIDDPMIMRMMDLQEKIHQTHGRERERIAIGIYEFDKIKFPVRYTTTTPDENRFIPLGFDEELSPAEILEKHPKGVEFGHILKPFDRYPILIDEKDDVLSIPPIINSELLGHVSKETRNLFIEATGTDFFTLSIVLNVMATTLSDRGGEIECVELLYPDVKRVTPDLNPDKLVLDPLFCQRLLDIDLKKEEIIDLLRRARFDASDGGDGIDVRIPPVRQDIIHQVDLVEEVAVMFGYGNIVPEMPKIPTIAIQDPIEERSDAVRELLIGLGFTEVMTFIMTNPENLFDKMRLEGEAVEIENPMVKTYSCFRSWILPSLLEFLSKNTHVSYPQGIYEVGDIVDFSDEGTETIRKIAAVWTDSKVNFTQMKSIVEAILNHLNRRCRFDKIFHPSFITGRVASFEGGFLGEIHPEVLENWGIKRPVLGFEMKLP
jgi:phenylalanyl-tRNA synthetase beta chain